MAWCELLGDQDASRIRRDGAYIEFVRDVLGELGVKRIDAQALVREAREIVDAKHRDAAMKSIAQLPPDLLELLEDRLKAMLTQKNH